MLIIFKFCFQKGEAQTITMLNKAFTSDACCNSVRSSQESRVSLIETHVDICLRRENNEFMVIPDITISDNESDDNSSIASCEMEIQKEEKCFDSRKKLIDTIRHVGNLQGRFNTSPANIRNILHGHFPPFHFPISFLKMSEEDAFLVFSGTRFHI